MSRAICVFISLLAVAVANEWNYDRCDAGYGPASWPLLCTATDGQSPINLCGAELFPAEKNTALDFSYANSVAFQVQSDGQAFLSQTGTETMTLDANDIPRIVGRQPESETDDITWKFAQAHFHWGRPGHDGEGSEHYIEGVQHELEIHFVHFNSKYADFNAAMESGETDALLVVGQMFNYEETVSKTPAAFLTVSTALFTGTTAINVKPDDLIDTSGGFYSYAGSLTVPTCNPVVTWVVMAKVIGIPRSALDSFHDQTTATPDVRLVGEYGSARPLQPLGSRTVYMTNGVTTLPCNAEGVREPHFVCSECEQNYQIRGTSEQTSVDLAASRRDAVASRPVSLASIFETRRSDSWNYDRSDAANGPAEWGSISGSQCNDLEQSPIDLCGGVPLPENRATVLKFDYPAEEIKMKLLTEGQALIQANAAQPMTLNAQDIPRIVGRQPESETDDITWKFAQAHFHWGRDRGSGYDGEGSEHYIEGVQHDLELHFVHYNSKYADFDAAMASGNKDALLVVGQLFSVDDAVATRSTEEHAVGATVAARRATRWNWDRCDETYGPEGWPSSDGSFCTAEEQSPIDLCGAELFPADKTTTLNFDYPAEEIAMEFRSDGQAFLAQTGTETMTLDANDIPRIVGRQPESETDDITWKFAQAHFHWGREGFDHEGSEHYIEGVQHELEIHFVHFNSKYADFNAAMASGNKDALLVVGQVFQVGTAMSDAMTEITGAFASASQTNTLHNVNIRPMELIDQSGGFYSYAGSLTIPACNPVVTWVVMSKVMTITAAGLKDFHTKTVTVTEEGFLVDYGNSRPLQPRGGRTVYMTPGVTTLPCHPYGAREPVWECDAGCGHYSKSTTSFKAIVSGLTRASAHAKEVEITVKPIDLIDTTGGFYSYAGSLTIPTCNSVVTWVVMSKVMMIPRSALDRFHDKTVDAEGEKSFFGNSRPLQEKNGRDVYVSKGVTTLECNPEGAREPYFPCGNDCIAPAKTRGVAASDEGALAVTGRRSTTWNWNRCDAINGPQDWPTNDESFCNAEEQSPIDLCGAEHFPPTRTTTLDFDYPATAVAMQISTNAEALLTQTGTETMTLDANDIPRIVGRQPESETDDITWKFAQAHFHWGRPDHDGEGSEHYIEGVQHPLEIHFVHFNSKYADFNAAMASGFKDALLVVGQFFQVGTAMSDAMTKITEAFADASTSKTSHDIDISPMELIDQSGGFYSYDGSLTVPTCNPVVTWVVMAKVATITKAGLKSFQTQPVTADGELVDYGNSRPLQPRGLRTVYMTKGVTTLPCNPYGAREPFWYCDCDKPATTPDSDVAVSEDDNDDDECDARCIGLAVALGIVGALLLGTLAYFIARTPTSQPLASRDVHQAPLSPPRPTTVVVDSPADTRSAAASEAKIPEDKLSMQAPMLYPAALPPPPIAPPLDASRATLMFELGNPVPQHAYYPAGVYGFR